MFVAHESEIPQVGDYVVRRVLEDSFIVEPRPARRDPGDVQHVPAPRHAGVPRRDGQRLALPLPVPRLVLPQRRPHRRSAVPQGGVRRRGGLRAEGPDAAAGAESGQLQRADLRQHGPGRPPLEEFLGDFKFYLDYYTKQSSSMASRCAARSAGGSRRTGRSAPRTSPATCTTRRRPTRASSRSACSASRRPRSARTATPTGRGKGGGTTYKLPPGTFEERMRYVGYPDEMIERMKELVAPSSSTSSGATAS